MDAQTRDMRDLSTRSGVTPSGSGVLVVVEVGGGVGWYIAVYTSCAQARARPRAAAFDQLRFCPSRPVLPEVDRDEEKRRGALSGDVTKGLLPRSPPMR